MTKYTNVTSRRQGKCIWKYVTICIPMALELHAPSPPSATHKLLVIVVHVSVTQTNREIPCLVKLYMYNSFKWSYNVLLDLHSRKPI